MPYTHGKGKAYTLDIPQICHKAHTIHSHIHTYSKGTLESPVTLNIHNLDCRENSLADMGPRKALTLLYESNILL